MITVSEATKHIKIEGGEQVTTSCQSDLPIDPRSLHSTQNEQHADIMQHFRHSPSSLYPLTCDSALPKMHGNAQ